MSDESMGMQLLGATRARIVDLLLEGPASPTQLAKVLEIQQSAVRAHLEGLERNGLVASTFKHGGVGRPKKFYSLTPDGRELLPRKYQLLLELVLCTILSRHGKNELEGVLSGVALELASRLPAEGNDATLERRVRRLVESLNELGFKARLSREGGELAIIRTNCVFHGTAEAHHDLICGVLDTQILQKSLQGAHVELVSCQSRGDACCKHVVTKAPPARATTTG